MPPGELLQPAPSHLSRPRGHEDTVQTFGLQQTSCEAETSQPSLSCCRPQNCVQNETRFYSTTFTGGLLHSNRTLKQRLKQNLKTTPPAKSMVLQGIQRAYISHQEGWSIVDRTRTLE
ncbi:hypothetical protein VULLAG_LOCUS6879 [Vulpes lagopus]